MTGPGSASRSEPLAWHYENDAMVHTGCGGDVLFLEGGFICAKCGAQQDGEAP